MSRDKEKREFLSVLLCPPVYHHEPQVQAGFVQLSSQPVACLTCTAFSWQEEDVHSAHPAHSSVSPVTFPCYTVRLSV